MKLRFSETKIEFWAERYPSENDGTVLELKDSVQRVGTLSKKQLQQVAHWKSPRSVWHIEKNKDGYVREITGWSFSATDERAKIEVLRLLDGVEWATASVILHLFHKQPYPILDFRALWSVSTDVPNQYTFDFWQQYFMFCRNIAVQKSLDMRTLDRALWQYSKENQNSSENKKIA